MLTQFHGKNMSKLLLDQVLRRDPVLSKRHCVARLLIHPSIGSIVFFPPEMTVSSAHNDKSQVIIFFECEILITKVNESCNINIYQFFFFCLFSSRLWGWSLSQLPQVLMWGGTPWTEHQPVTGLKHRQKTLVLTFTSNY